MGYISQKYPKGYETERRTEDPSMDYAIHTPKQLGAVVRGQRKTLKLSQTAVASTVGLLPKTVSKLEQAPDTATLESLFKLLSALRLELVVRSRAQEPSPREW